MTENLKPEATEAVDQPEKPVSRVPFNLPRLNLAGALAIAIFAACLIVGVAYGMYYNNSNRKYDIARGGEEVNQALGVDDEEADTTSPVTATSTKQKLEFLNKEINALNGLNKFDANDLNDQSILLMPSDQPSL